MYLHRNQRGQHTRFLYLWLHRLSFPGLDKNYGDELWSDASPSLDGIISSYLRVLSHQSTLYIFITSI